MPNEIKIKHVMQIDKLLEMVHKYFMSYCQILGGCYHFMNNGR